MVLDDHLEPGLKVVFCGTAAGLRSAELRQYYAKPGNRFWPALHEAGFTQRRYFPIEGALLPGLGIGLTDLSKTAKGMDSGLKRDDFDAALLRSKIEEFQPALLAFTSKRAAQEFFGIKTVAYGLQAARIGMTGFFVLPSPSGAARGSWDVAHWKALARLAGFSA